jgi:GTP-binding protein Era
MGKPNVGKSTLMNIIVGQKVSIVSNKPQTTRKNVVGIANGPDYQIVFIDTPGVHDPHTRLGRYMVDQARSSVSGAEVIVYVADGSHHPGEMDLQIAEFIKKAKTPEQTILLCMNKMDLLKAEDVQRNVDAYSAALGTDIYMLTTAIRGVNVDKLTEMIAAALPVHPPYFDPDEFTDQSSRYIASELVREKILIASRQEIPHSVAVMVENWEETPNLTRISATIFVEKVSQRAIVIGKGGSFLKKIGTDARAEIEKLIGKSVFLDLHVKVEEGWRMNPRLLHELQYDQ